MGRGLARAARASSSARFFARSCIKRLALADNSADAAAKVKDVEIEPRSGSYSGEILGASSCARGNSSWPLGPRGSLLSYLWLNALGSVVRERERFGYALIWWLFGISSTLIVHAFTKEQRARWSEYLWAWEWCNIVNRTLGWGGYRTCKSQKLRA